MTSRTTLLSLALPLPLALALASVLALTASQVSAAQTDQFEPPLADYGTTGEHLAGLLELADAAQDAANRAVEAVAITEIKVLADQVYASVWGRSSGLVDNPGAAAVAGWKTRWQVTFTDFDPAFGARYAGKPAEISNPSQLGIAGRGRYVRRHLAAQFDTTKDAQQQASTEQLIASLNNVIGWMRIDDGVTKAERQPRVDLTYQWDAPKSFWQGSADTGWIYEVQAQALNILKTNYGTDLETARNHAQGMADLMRKCREGTDANGNGNIEPTQMEGGLAAVMLAGQRAGLL